VNITRFESWIEEIITIHDRHPKEFFINMLLALASEYIRTNISTLDTTVGSSSSVVSYNPLKVCYDSVALLLSRVKTKEEQNALLTYIFRAGQGHHKLQESLFLTLLSATGDALTDNIELLIKGSNPVQLESFWKDIGRDHYLKKNATLNDTKMKVF